MRGLILCLISLVVLLQMSHFGQAAERTAVIIPLHEDINPLSGELLKRKFNQAVESGVDVIILDIHSPGGYTYVTFELMDLITDAKDVETVAFIQKDAISGAALLSLACDKIIMLPDARMGDAGEIVMGADGAFRYTEAKSRSVLAQKVRDTAKATGRPIALAEKMVDKDMVVYHATHKTNGETRYISSKEWDSLKDVDDWVKGKPVREAGKGNVLHCQWTTSSRTRHGNTDDHQRHRIGRDAGRDRTHPSNGTVLDRYIRVLTEHGGCDLPVDRNRVDCIDLRTQRPRNGHRWADVTVVF